MSTCVWVSLMTVQEVVELVIRIDKLVGSPNNPEMDSATSRISNMVRAMVGELFLAFPRF